MNILMENGKAQDNDIDLRNLNNFYRFDNEIFLGRCFIESQIRWRAPRFVLGSWLQMEVILSGRNDGTIAGDHIFSGLRANLGILDK